MIMRIWLLDSLSCTIQENKRIGMAMINNDWPCVCGHTKAQHTDIRDHVIGYTFKSACAVISNPVNSTYADNCESFLPIPNLEYLEMKIK